MTGLLKGVDTRSPLGFEFSEVTFPPFGFVMTLERDDFARKRILS
jgi:hypothetical protein